MLRRCCINMATWKCINIFYVNVYQLYETNCFVAVPVGTVAQQFPLYTLHSATARKPLVCLYRWCDCSITIF